MKKNIYLICSALVFGMLFVSCGSKTESEDVKISGELKVMGAKTADASLGDELDLLFTGDDIKSFLTACESDDFVNCDSFIGEIVFSGLKADDVMYNIGLYHTIYFYVGETLLFDPPIKLHQPYSSYCPEDLYMFIDYSRDKFLLSEWYRVCDNDNWLSAAEKKAIRKQQEENSKMRKRQVDVFFKYLKDNGKLVE